ncbi:hypothetical protein O3G_MSEX009566 [Manduca sexta]|uniref:Dynamin-type G domain-containing protein n=1 Tax=Manduca sexta TaxID=7130 RepID=A0A921ZEP6_MANSE|nr:hypothetical protein O3G_MSEX009566 [Manduca sexta]KAG6456116.1 hypothetical protein O3G_MSEX009566 [Manduca sexta]KAG6456117.1 hypothetical protein O3G_MSEX009566 [Manduca sexta]KAG6456118.1 hypothetical protein O3G_MSEX009566 [Manduca sexta]KAG6456119.1 hypothetical protein O3G_MSEX009566 [Manduca sexta]
MWTKRLTLWRYMLCVWLVASAVVAVARADDDVPSESQCRPYIEKALKELESGDTERDSAEKNDSSEVSINEDTKETASIENEDDTAEAGDSGEDEAPVIEVTDESYVSQASIEDLADSDSSKEDTTQEVDDKDSAEQADDSKQDEDGDSNQEDDGDSKQEDDGDSKEEEVASADETVEQESEEEKVEKDEAEGDSNEGSKEVDDDSKEEVGDDGQSDEVTDTESEEKQEDDIESHEADDGSQEKADVDSDEKEKEDSEEAKDDESQEDQDDAKSEENLESAEDKDESKEVKDDSGEASEEAEGDKEESEEKVDSEEEADKSEEAKDTSVDQDDSSKQEEELSEEKEEQEKDASVEDASEKEEAQKSEEEAEEQPAEESKEEQSEVDASTEVESEGAEEQADEAATSEEEEEGTPEEELLNIIEIPENLRSRNHINQILRLDEEASEAELVIERSADIVLRDLKRLYENSIKPLEVLYKYRDLSNRHFGDPEIFSKPLVLFMGPWSGGKSSILNYLTGLEFTEWSLRTGAEPSPAYFNILMHGKDPEVLDGTQLAADWTFAGLQKFGQGLEERLRGLKYPSKILEKVNIVEIPGILEVRKQVSRVFPFNDACQWFIDRADIIFLVYDPSKLDVGPETEAILDQLKGRESQTRIVLNKADSVKPEELMRVQSALIWNISPLMSSAQPPVMYTVSLWSMPYEAGAPMRLFQAQERELLRDLRHAIDKRIENKIASARRFAVRVRNHAKMVDCYLTTYYNHKTIFGNKKLIADAIIENPQNYHIYEGLSTLTNISRYDLPDPETYRDFFRLNPLYEFQQLSATCTYFRGCPITRLDVAIAYDLPELVGKYKKMVESATPQGMPKS